MSDYEHLSHPSSMSSSASDRQKAKLIYCKSHVAIHPTQFNKDNISGYFSVVETKGRPIQTDDEGGVSNGSTTKEELTGRELLVTWVPDELLDKMDEDDKRAYKKVEARVSGGDAAKIHDEEGELVLMLSLALVSLKLISPPRRFCLRISAAAKGGEVCVLGAGFRHLQCSSVSCELSRAPSRFWNHSSFST